MPRLALLFGLVPLLGLVELALHRHFASSAPGFDAYAALGPELSRAKLPGMPVVVSPRWAEPLVRQAAPAAFPLEELGRADDGGFASFLEVSLLGASAPELAPLTVRTSRRFGPFTLTVRDNPRPEVVRFDFVSAVAQGEVEVFNVVGAEHTPCTLVERDRATAGGLHGPAARPRMRRECPGGRVVGVSLIEDQDYRARRCILVDPVNVGTVLLRFSSVPEAKRLIGFVGHSYFLHRDVTAKTVELVVSEGGRELGKTQVVPSAGWSRFELPRAGAAGAVEVSIERLLPEPGDFCFALEAR